MQITEYKNKNGETCFDGCEQDAVIENKKRRPIETLIKRNHINNLQMVQKLRKAK